MYIKKQTIREKRKKRKNEKKKKRNTGASLRARGSRRNDPIPRKKRTEE